MAAVRTEMIVPNEKALQKGQLENIPLERAKRALAENPDAPLRTVAKQAGVSKNTVARARQQIASDEAKPSKPPKMEPQKPDFDREFAAWLWRKADRDDLARVIEWLGVVDNERVRQFLTKSEKQ